jgi:hypothetical protein
LIKDQVLALGVAYSSIQTRSDVSGAAAALTNARLTLRFTDVHCRRSLHYGWHASIYSFVLWAWHWFWVNNFFPVRDREAKVTHHNFRITCSAFWAMSRPRALWSRGGGPICVCRRNTIVNPIDFLLLSTARVVYVKNV